MDINVIQIGKFKSLLLFLTFAIHGFRVGWKLQKRNQGQMDLQVFAYLGSRTATCKWKHFKEHFHYFFFSR